MTRCMIFCSVLFAIFFIIATHAQELVYPTEPQELWRKTFNAMGEGNGVFLTPSRDKLVAVSRVGILRAYDPANGDVLWTFSPPSMSGGSVSCEGGIIFLKAEGQAQMAYLVIDSVGGTVTMRILVLTLDGQQVWQSASVPGAGAGSPQATSDGRYLVATHNLNQRGYFSLFNTQSNSTAPIYQYESDLLIFDQSTPFSAVGVYHSPLEGFYDSESNNGRSNTNDLFVFMTDTNTDVVNSRGDPLAGNGQMYVFQMNADYFVTEDVASLGVIPIGPIRGYQAKTAPLLTEGGQTMYWSMVRGEVRGWVGQRFNRGHTSTVNLGRGEPAYIAGRATPTMSHSTVDPSVFGPGASAVIWKADRALENATIVPTDGIVSGRLAVTSDDQFVAYGTQTGNLYLANTADLSTYWVYSSSLNPIRADVAMDETRIFVGDDRGNGVGQVVAIKMAHRQDVSSPAPSPGPSAFPSMEPAALSTATPSVPPTMSSPEASPTSRPTVAPVTLEPTRLGLVQSTLVPGTPSPTRTGNVANSSASPLPALLIYLVVCLLGIVTLW